jgi:hypothetical protein
MPVLCQNFHDSKTENNCLQNCLAKQNFKLVNFSEVMNREVIKYYTIYGLLFVGSVYASMKSLQFCNVETQIVFRAATPLTVCGALGAATISLLTILILILIFHKMFVFVSLF